MAAVKKIHRLLRLASACLAEVNIQKADLGPEGVSFCNIVSLSEAVADLTNSAFIEYLKKVRLMSCSDQDVCEIFYKVAHKKISRKISRVFLRILISETQ